MNESNKKNMAEEKVLLARMVKDFGLYSAQDVFEQHLEKEEFFTQDGNFSLKYVAPYERKGRKDKNSDGFDKPKVKVNAFFRKGKMTEINYKNLRNQCGSIRRRLIPSITTAKENA